MTESNRQIEETKRRQVEAQQIDGALQAHVERRPSALFVVSVMADGQARWDCIAMQPGLMLQAAKTLEIMAEHNIRKGLIP